MCIQVYTGKNKHFKSVKRRQVIRTYEKVNRCRPGFGASCSFCCGSHNYTMAPDSIEELFAERDRNSSLRILKHPEHSTREKLVKEGMQCPHVGISEYDPGLVCCLAYLDDHNKSSFESFFKGTCKNFFCSAWDELTDRQVLFAAELMKDWYYYSLLINSIEILINLCAEYDSPDDVPEDLLNNLKDELEQKLHEEDLI